MNDIIIDTRDFNFLIQSKLDGEVIECLERSSKIQYDTVYLKIDREIVGRILDFIENDLMINGFSENDEPNDLGIMLENLIDKFSREYYSPSSP